MEVTGLIKPWEVRYPPPNVPLRGIWLVGSEWGAGTYQITPHPDGNTYWERWADINGETVIASDSTTGPSVMSVDPADVAAGVHGVWALEGVAPESRSRRPPRHHPLARPLDAHVRRHLQVLRRHVSATAD